MFSSCAAHGGAELDHSALILAIEGLAAHIYSGEEINLPLGPRNESHPLNRG